jgi:hypothetical protein
MPGEKPPLRFERMPFIPRLESLGFSGIAYKDKSVKTFKYRGLCTEDGKLVLK